MNKCLMRRKGRKMRKEKKNRRLVRIPVHYLRFTMLALLFFVQVAVFVMLIDYGAKYFWVYTTLEVLSAVITIALIARSDNPTYKIAWIVVIMALPIFGICIYIVFGANSLKKADMMRLARIERKYVAEIKGDLRRSSDCLADSPRALLQAKYLEIRRRLMFLTAPKPNTIRSATFSSPTLWRRWRARKNSFFLNIL